MLKWAIIFLIISLIAGGLGFANVSDFARKIAFVLFGLFFIGFLIMLGFALLHGVNGLRYSIDDYFKRPGTRFWVKAVVFTVTAVVFVLGGISVVFLYFTWGPQAFYIVASRMWTTMNNFTLIAIPLYILMAMILERAGVAQRLYHMMHLWWGGVRGGLAIGTIFICAIFGAMVGISGAAVVSMGTIALPAMLKRGYDKELALGAINTGGGCHLDAVMLREALDQLPLPQVGS